MNSKVKKEVEKLIKKLNLNCSIEQFKDKVDWYYISEYQKLSEDFIREFQDKVKWDWISMFQKLSEDLIREFQNKIDWYNISYHQKLSEDFIREFQDKGKIKVTKKTKSEILEELKGWKKIVENIEILGKYNSVNPRQNQLDYSEIDWDR